MLACPAEWLWCTRGWMAKTAWGPCCVRAACGLGRLFSRTAAAALQIAGRLGALLCLQRAPQALWTAVTPRWGAV
eukprot:2009664-Alexandrium_andersonii.AAC.1